LRIIHRRFFLATLFLGFLKRKRRFAGKAADFAANHLFTEKPNII